MRPGCRKGFAAGFPPGFTLPRDGCRGAVPRLPQGCNPEEMMMTMMMWASSRPQALPLPALPGPSHPPPGQLQLLLGRKQEKANLYLKKKKKKRKEKKILLCQWSSLKDGTG